MATTASSTSAASHDETIDRYGKYVTTSFVASLEPVVVDRAEGAKIWDVDGTEYIDCFAGIAVNNAGHRHPKVIAAVKDAARQGRPRGDRTSTTSRLWPRRPRSWPRSRPGRLQKTFFGNSGAEGIETAMRLAKAYTGKREVHLADPLIPRPHLRHPLGHRQQSAQNARRAIHARRRLCPDALHLPQPVRDRRSGGRRGALCRHGRVGDRLPDERRCRGLHLGAGLGRGRDHRAARIPTSGGSRRSSTATASSSSATRCNPVSVAAAISSRSSTSGSSRTSWSLAKGIADGFPIEATIAPPEIADSLKPGEHLRPSAATRSRCAAASANIEVMLEEDLPGQSARKGERSWPACAS